MKIVCISDTHGYLPENLPDGDVLVIAGDICPVINHNVLFQKEWLKGNFNPWLKSLSFKDKVVIAGNHDWIFEKLPGEIPALDCDYLNNSSVIIDHIKFYGYPETPAFCDWAFNRNREELDIITNHIPDDTDVLITHGPPFGILDTVEGVMSMNRGKVEKEYLGCKALKKKINSMPNLKLNVFGHIHSGHGIDKINNTIFVNASYINEQYVPDYEIITVEI